ncbi:MAG: sigma 54-interacting transcriptional regulator [Pseudomonadota bacterium]
MDRKKKKEKPNELHKPASFTDVILDSVADGVFTVDREWIITSFNRAAEKITGIEREFAVGSLCHTIFRANICETGCALRETLRTGKSIVNKAIYIVRPDGKSMPISISTGVLRNEDGQVVGGVETFRDLSIIEKLRRDLIQSSSFHDIISRNHKMRRVFSILPNIARSESTVLIQGSSGSGKELIARAIHDLSPRREGPLIIINCGALPDTLLESELFGYRAGAFTDAKEDKPGKFALADGGTLFLDEVGDVSPALQARLLRVLQDKVFEPLGDTKSYQADVRIVAATNKDIKGLMREGQFRKDLFYRLSVVEIELPDLAERMEDVPLLANHFLQQLCRIHNKDIIGISEEVLALLLRHDFPGNVRELMNIVEYAFVLCPGGLILVEHLPEKFVQTYKGKKLDKAAKQTVNKLADVEADLISETLKKNNFHRQKTAKELGISKTTLWRKIKHYGIEIDG